MKTKRNPKNKVRPIKDADKNIIEYECVIKRNGRKYTGRGATEGDAVAAAKTEMEMER